MPSSSESPIPEGHTERHFEHVTLSERDRPSLGENGGKRERRGERKGRREIERREKQSRESLREGGSRESLREGGSRESLREGGALHPSTVRELRLLLLLPSAAGETQGGGVTGDTGRLCYRRDTGRWCYRRD